MKSQPRAHHSTPKKSSAGTSRQAERSEPAKPRNGPSHSAKTNGNGKAKSQASGASKPAKRQLVKNGASKTLGPTKSLTKKSAKSSTSSKVAASVRHKGNGDRAMGSKVGVRAAVSKPNGAVKSAKAVAANGKACSGMSLASGSAASRTSGKVKAVAGTMQHGTVGIAQSAGGTNSLKASAKIQGAAAHKSNGSKKPMPRKPITDLPPDYRPSDSEPFMGELQKFYFRRKLLTWRDEILRSTRETLQSLHDDQAHYADIADRATSESDKALELRARDRQRKLIAKIDAAVERIDRGTYGYCAETGEPIAVRRLDARPIATLSIEAQERHERRERVYRDD
jgi:DnaK suppressor protein